MVATGFVMLYKVLTFVGNKPVEFGSRVFDSAVVVADILELCREVSGTNDLEIREGVQWATI